MQLPSGGGARRLGRKGLGGWAGLGHIAIMSRPILALLAGLVGFAAYVGVVVLLADWVLTLHWLVQLAYFLVAGLAWVPPARRLMFWGAGVTR